MKLNNDASLQIFDMFDVKRKGVIDFGDFVRSLNVFHPNASLEDKIDCKLSKDSFISSVCRSLYVKSFIDSGLRFFLSYV